MKMTIFGWAIGVWDKSMKNRVRQRRRRWEYVFHNNTITLKKLTTQKKKKESPSLICNQEDCSFPWQLLSRGVQESTPAKVHKDPGNSTPRILTHMMRPRKSRLRESTSSTGILCSQSKWLAGISGHVLSSPSSSCPSIPVTSSSDPSWGRWEGGEARMPTPTLR